MLQHDGMVQWLFLSVKTHDSSGAVSQTKSRNSPKKIRAVGSIKVISSNNLIGTSKHRSREGKYHYKGIRYTLERKTKQAQFEQRGKRQSVQSQPYRANEIRWHICSLLCVLLISCLSIVGLHGCSIPPTSTCFVIRGTIFPTKWAK
jgi:hypothetical protein